MSISAYWYRRSDSRPWLSLSRGAAPAWRNFGDEFSSDFIRWWSGQDPTRSQLGPARLVVGGSILHLLRAGDLVLSVGSRSPEARVPQGLTVFGVRGLLTRQSLERSGYDFSAQPLFLGDIGILAPQVYGRPSAPCDSAEVVILPHFRHERRWRSIAKAKFPSSRLLSPSLPPSAIARIISSATRIITSSLHGIIFGYAYGLDVAWVAPPREERLWKFHDFFSVFTDKPPAPISDLSAAARSESTWAPSVAQIEARAAELPSWPEIRALLAKDVLS